NDFVEKIDTNGKIKVIAGGGGTLIPDTSGTQNATDIRLNIPSGVVVDTAGNIYITDSSNNLVEKVDTNGKIKRIVGGGAGSANTSGTQNATDISLSGASGIALDSSGNIYISEQNNNLVSKLNTLDKIKVIAGGSSSGTANTSGTQNATNIKINSPFGIAVDSFGSVYITDQVNNLIEKVVNVQ
ncbi:MAG: hypothetical protein AABZ74_16695, partial [Cyanobacteriota bacterium]